MQSRRWYSWAILALVPPAVSTLSVAALVEGGHGLICREAGLKLHEIGFEDVHTWDTAAVESAAFSQAAAPPSTSSPTSFSFGYFDCSPCVSVGHGRAGVAGGRWQHCRSSAISRFPWPRQKSQNVKVKSKVMFCFCLKVNDTMNCLLR